MIKCKLGQIASISNGKSNVQDAVAEGKYPFFDRSQVIKRSNRYLFDCEAIIVPGEGKEFLPRYYVGKFDLHQRCYKIVPSNAVLGKYLFYNILAHKAYFARVATGSTVPSLRLRNFTEMELTIHSLEEQQHIVDVIQSRFSISLSLFLLLYLLPRIIY